MRILFVLTLTSLVRHFESVILMLAERGHTIRIATPGRATNWPLPDAITAHPGISEVVCPEERSDEWKQAARIFRLMVDYRRFLEPPFLQAEKLRERAYRELVEALTDRHVGDEALMALVPSRGKAADRVSELLQLIEGVIPSDPGRDAFLMTEQPDVVLVTPLIGLGSEQTDWVKSARRLGIPVACPVFSWDNLTTKGLIHEQPDRVFVWNDIQEREAIDYHAVPADRIVVTGAPRFDAFMAMSPKKSRETFCARYGLQPDRPILTYLCSSEFVAGGEVAFVRAWIDEIRKEPSLAECNVLIRPHPRALDEWITLDTSGWPQVGVARSKLLNADQLLYDTLFHSAAVIGLNTSAQLEAGMLGKPVYTVLAPGFERGQQGTLHFRYLLQEEGGFVQVAKDFDEHRAHLADAVAGRYDAAQIRRFIERFIRPAGWDRAATPLLVDAVEAMRPAKTTGLKRWFVAR
jgi:hypothetical protein